MTLKNTCDYGAVVHQEPRHIHCNINNILICKLQNNGTNCESTNEAVLTPQVLMHNSVFFCRYLEFFTSSFTLDSQRYLCQIGPDAGAHVRRHAEHVIYRSTYGRHAAELPDVTFFQ